MPVGTQEKLDRNYSIKLWGNTGWSVTGDVVLVLQLIQIYSELEKQTTEKV